MILQVGSNPKVLSIHRADATQLARHLNLHVRQQQTAIRGEGPAMDPFSVKRRGVNVGVACGTFEENGF